jgi:hypothetical protein
MASTRKTLSTSTTAVLAAKGDAATVAGDDARYHTDGDAGRDAVNAFEV